MTVEQWLLIGIIVASTTLHITQWTKTEVTALMTIVALALSGTLTPEQALSGFSSSALVTVAAMFVLSAGLLKTGAMQAAVVFLGRYAGGNPRRLLAAIGVATAPTSAFVNNTPVVVMMLPVLLTLGRTAGLRASKVLIPLSYFAILGGTLTLIGTSTNILLDELYRKAGGPGFNLFDFTPLGLIYLLAGGTYLLLFSERLLPDKTSLADLGTPNGVNRYVSEVVIDGRSTIIGRRVTAVIDIADMPSPHNQTQMRHRRIDRTQGNARTPRQTKQAILFQLVRDGTAYLGPDLNALTFANGDTLLVAGTAAEIRQFVEQTRSQFGSALQDDRRVPLDDIGQKVVEAVVLPNSPYAGQVIGEMKLHQGFGVSILGLQHEGRQLLSGLRSLRLESGDMLLLHGAPNALQMLSEQGRLILVEGVEEEMTRTTKHRVALGIMLGVVLLSVFTPVSISILALGGAVVMILLHCLRVDEALHALDSSTLFLIAGAIPLGVAMETTGLAQLIVDTLLVLLAGASPLLFISIFYLLTSLLTEILSNNAVAVLLTPIAYSLSITLGIDPKPLLMAVAFGASASFMTPIGYQTNAIVMGPGGYSFRDYLRIGVPLNILLWLVASIFIPLLYAP